MKAASYSCPHCRYSTADVDEAKAHRCADRIVERCALPVTVFVHMRVPSLANQRQHWAARARQVKKQRQAVAWVLKGKRLPTLPVKVTMTRLAPRLLDSDNAVISLKGVRDEVASALGVDDRDPRVEWSVQQWKAAKANEGVQISIEHKE